MDEITWKKYGINDLQDKVMKIMVAADEGNDKLYGKLGAELVGDIEDKIDEIIRDIKK